jgi:hypothetical protein
MKANIIRIGAFFIALFIGVQIPVFVSDAAGLFMKLSAIERSDVAVSEDMLAKPIYGVRISYIGTSVDDPDFGSTMRFLVYNGSQETISCRGYAGKCADPEILIRGRDEKAWVCMRGSSVYSIGPGATAGLIVSPYNFATIPRRSAEVTVGLEFTEPGVSTARYFAEPVTLPPAFKNEIRDHLAETASN